MPKCTSFVLRFGSTASQHARASALQQPAARVRRASQSQPDATAHKLPQAMLIRGLLAFFIRGSLPWALKPILVRRGRNRGGLLRSAISCSPSGCARALPAHARLCIERRTAQATRQRAPLVSRLDETRSCWMLHHTASCIMLSSMCWKTACGRVLRRLAMALVVTALPWLGLGLLGFLGVSVDPTTLLLSTGLASLGSAVPQP